MASSSPSPPPRRRDHRVGGLRAIHETIVEPLAPVPPILPVPGIYNANLCLTHIIKAKDAAQAHPKKNTIAKAYTTVNSNAIKEVLSVFDPEQKGCAKARNIYNRKPSEFPWINWSNAVRAFRQHTYEVDENRKLFVDGLEVLPIEDWHSTFVRVYSTHADFSARYAASMTMTVTTAFEVADKMGDTYFFNKKLLVTCIHDNEYVPTNPIPVPAAVEEPQERTLEEEQPNATQLVATSGDGRRGLVVTESFAPSRKGYNNMGSHNTISNVSYAGANISYAGANIYPNVTSAADMDSLSYRSIHAKLDKLTTATKATNTKLDHLDTAVRMSTTKKQHPAQTQRNDLGVLGRSHSFEGRMAAGGSPLRSTTLEDSPGKHSFEAGDIGRRGLFANASVIRRSNFFDESTTGDELVTGDDGTDALSEPFGENFSIQGSGENSPGNQHGFEADDSDFFAANASGLRRSNSDEHTMEDEVFTGDDVTGAPAEPSGEKFTLEDSPGNHSFEGRGIRGRELFAANASGLWRSNCDESESTMEDELFSGDGDTGALLEP